MTMYYRLYDKQTGRYMFTGYNSSSKKELIEDFILYKSSELEEQELLMLKSITKKQMFDFIESCDFIIEKSSKKFEDID